MNANWMKPLLLLIVGVAASGCAPIYEARYDYRGGWRDVTVLQVAPARDITGNAWVDCRGVLGATDPRQFAYARYSFPQSGLHRAIVPIQEGLRLSPGDRIYINIRHCNQPIARVAESK